MDWYELRHYYKNVYSEGIETIRYSNSVDHLKKVADLKYSCEFHWSKNVLIDDDDTVRSNVVLINDIPGTEAFFRIRKCTHQIFDYIEPDAEDAPGFSNGTDPYYDGPYYRYGLSGRFA